MLIEFTVGNFRSFKEPVTFSMVAANLKSQDKAVDENNTFEVSDKLRLVKSAAIYGANASGKSNLVLAMQFMRQFVVNSSRESQAGDPIPVEVFCLNERMLNEPSFFQIVFLQNGVQYRYGFEVTAERVTTEWLFAYGRTKEANLFQRDRDVIRVSPTKFKEGKGLEDKTRPNALFLSVVAQFNGNIAFQLFDWFAYFHVIPRSIPNQYLGSSLKMFFDSEYSEEMFGLLRGLDLSIQYPRVYRDEIEHPGLLTDAPEKIKQEVASQGKIEVFQMKTVHLVFDDHGNQMGTKDLDLDKTESDGTQKLIALLGPIVDALRHGKVLIIDELDARLHPLITCVLIRLFNSRTKNPLNAQVIFSTHDTNLLSKDLFRRDQIWFMEKDRLESSHLYSLVEFRVRNDSSSLESDYIHGKFGAIPFLGDLSRVFETSEAENGAKE